MKKGELELSFFLLSASFFLFLKILVIQTVGGRIQIGLEGLEVVGVIRDGLDRLGA